MNFRNVALVCLALALSACAQVPGKASAIAEQSQPVVSEKEPNLPKIDLTSQLLYEFLIAEVAGQRGNLGLATEAYLDLAKTTRDPRFAKRATEVGLYSRRLPQAFEAAKLWRDLEPEADTPRQTVIALLVSAGKLEEARPLLEQMLVDDKTGRGQGFLYLSSLLSKHANKPEALDFLEKLARPYPEVPEAHFAIAQLAFSAEKLELALEEIRAAAKLRPDWEAAALFQGQLLQHASPALANDFYKSYLSRYANAREVRLAYARSLVNDKNYAAAREEFRNLLQAFPDNAEVAFAVGLLSLQLDDYGAAEDYFKQALTLKYKDENTVRLYLGQLNEERQRLEDATRWYASVGVGEQFLTAQLRVAGILAKQGKLDEARKYLQQVTVHNNQQRVLLIQAEAQLLRDAKSYQAAYDLLTQGLEKLPNYPDLLYDRAMVAEKIGRLDILEQDLRKLIQLKPDYAHAYNALGYTLAERTTRFDEAKTLLEKALKLSPEDPFIMDSMGWLQHRMGQQEKAVEYLQRAYGIRPDPEIAAHLGEVLWVQGKREEAKKLWQSALKASPQNEQLLDVLKKFSQ